MQDGIKIVCLNCYLGSVNTSGQQELKLNSVLTQAVSPPTPPLSVLHPHPHLITRTSPWIWAKGTVVRLQCRQFTTEAFSPDASDTHVEWKFPKAEERGIGAAHNYAGLSDSELARIHQIPLMLGRPTATPVIPSFPGTMVDSCLSLCRLWCTLSLVCRGAASLVTSLVAVFFFFFFIWYRLPHRHVDGVVCLGSHSKCVTVWENLFKCAVY